MKTNSGRDYHHPNVHDDRWGEKESQPLACLSITFPSQMKTLYIDLCDSFIISYIRHIAKIAKTMSHFQC